MTFWGSINREVREVIRNREKKGIQNYTSYNNKLDDKKEYCKKEEKQGIYRKFLKFIRIIK